MSTFAWTVVLLMGVVLFAFCLLLAYMVGWDAGFAEARRRTAMHKEASKEARPTTPIRNKALAETVAEERRMAARRSADTTPRSNPVAREPLP